MRPTYRSLLTISILPLLVFTLAVNTSAQQTAADAQKQAEAEFKRLTDLRTALEDMPFNAQDKEPHKSLIKRNKNYIFYNDPAGVYIVRSARFWELYEKYKHLPIADEIAWAAAQNPVGGECEGFVNCYLKLLRTTVGRYLEAYPDGKHSSTALSEMSEFVSNLKADAKGKDLYTWPEDSAGRNELFSTLTEVETLLAKVKDSAKVEILADLTALKASLK